MGTYGTPNEQLLLQVIADISQYIRGIDQSIAKTQELQRSTESASSRVTSSFEKIGAGAATMAGKVVGVLAPIGAAITAIIGEGVASIMQSETTLARIGIMVRNQGDDWASLRGQVKQFVDVQAELGGVLDQEVLRALQMAEQRGNNLAASENIVSAAMKVHVATGMDVARVTFLLSGAIGGLTYGLNRFGIFTRAEIEHLKGLKDPAERAAYIIGLMNDKFKDTGPPTYEQQLGRLNKAFHNLGEALAQGVMPAINAWLPKVTQGVKDLTAFVDKLPQATKEIIAFGSALLGLQTAIQILGRLFFVPTQLLQQATIWRLLGGAIGLVGSLLGILTRGFVALVSAIQLVAGGLPVIDALLAALGPIGLAVAAAALIAFAASWIFNWGNMRKHTADAVNAIVEVLKNPQRSLADLKIAIGDFLIWVANLDVAGAFTSAFSGVGNAIVRAISDGLGRAKTTIERWVVDAVNALKKIDWKAAWDAFVKALGDGLNNAITAIKEWIPKAVAAVTNPVEWAKAGADIGRTILQNMILNMIPGGSAISQIRIAWQNALRGMGEDLKQQGERTKAMLQLQTRDAAESMAGWAKGAFVSPGPPKYPPGGGAGGSALAEAEKALSLLESRYKLSLISIDQLIAGYKNLLATAKLTADERVQFEEHAQSVFSGIASERLSAIKAEIAEGRNYVSALNEAASAVQKVAPLLAPMEAKKLWKQFHEWIISTGKERISAVKDEVAAGNLTWQQGLTAIQQIVEAASKRVGAAMKAMIAREGVAAELDELKTRFQQSVTFIQNLVEKKVSPVELVAAFRRVNDMLDEMQKKAPGLTAEIEKWRTELKKGEFGQLVSTLEPQTTAAQQTADKMLAIQRSLAQEEAAITGRSVDSEIAANTVKFDEIKRQAQEAFNYQIALLNLELVNTNLDAKEIIAIYGRIAAARQAFADLSARITIDQTAAEDKIKSDSALRHLETLVRVGLRSQTELDQELQRRRDVIEAAGGRENDEWLAILEKQQAGQVQATDRQIRLIREETRGNETEYIRRLTAYVAMLNQKAAADDKYKAAAIKAQQDLADAITQAAEKARQPWDELWRGMSSSMERFLEGVLEGTQSMGNLWKALLKDMERAWAHSLAKMIQQYIDDFLNQIKNQAEQGGAGGGIFGQLFGWLARIFGAKPPSVIMTAAGAGTTGVPITQREQFSGTERFAMATETFATATARQTENIGQEATGLATAATQAATEAANQATFQAAVVILQQSGTVLLQAGQMLLQAASAMGSGGGGQGLPGILPLGGGLGGTLFGGQPIGVPLPGLVAAAEGGGIVRPPTGANAMPVIAHAGEVILNTAQQRALVGVGAGPGGSPMAVTLQFQLTSLDPKTAADVIIANHPAIMDAFQIGLRSNHMVRRILGGRR